MSEHLSIGDSVFNSPVGSGTLTGITDAGYPQVNHVAVARLVYRTSDGKFIAYDPTHSYGKGDWEMFLDDERYPGKDVSESVAVVRSSKEAIDFCEAVGSLPKNIMFDHDLGGDDTSMKFINWMIERIYDDKPKRFGIRADFKFSVHSQNPVGAKNIESVMNNLIRDQLHTEMK